MSQVTKIDEKKTSIVDIVSELLNKTHLSLEDTTELMTSEDYKERFVAEYFQAKIRFDALNSTIIKMEAGTLDFTPACPINMFQDQLYYMNEYIKILRVRAEKEGISLEPPIPYPQVAEELPKEETTIEEKEIHVDDTKDKEEN